MVGIPDPQRRMKAFPHEMSGGMAQRVMIAMALACEPELLIADEPTTALDVTIQAQILDLMRNLRDETGTAIVLITHDLGVVAEMCDRVAVMYAGEIVEQTDVTTLFRDPLHPYTQGLIGSIPVVGALKDELAVIPGNVPNLIDLPVGLPLRAALRDPRRGGHHAGARTSPRAPAGQARPRRPVLAISRRTRRSPAPAGPRRPGRGRSDRPARVRRRPASDGQAQPAMPPRPAPRAGERPLVKVTDLVKHFPIRGGILQRTIGMVQAVDGVSFEIRRGETLGLVGESGCGKTTVGRLILRLIEPTAGSIVFDGDELTALKGAALKPYRRRMQIIFQDPYASLDPRTPIGDSIGEGLRIHDLGTSAERREKVRKMMDLVGLAPYHARRYPHEFSGGQRQRIGIARALVLEPDLIVCDEPVSALDVSIQAQVLNLLKQLQRELGLTYVFVAHNMGVVEHISDRVAVMYLGRIAELADRRALFRKQEHPTPRRSCRPSRSPTRRCAASGSSSRATCRAR